MDTARPVAQVSQPVGVSLQLQTYSDSAGRIFESLSSIPSTRVGYLWWRRLGEGGEVGSTCRGTRGGYSRSTAFRVKAASPQEPMSCAGRSGDDIRWKPRFPFEPAGQLKELAEEGHHAVRRSHCSRKGHGYDPAVIATQGYRGGGDLA